MYSSPARGTTILLLLKSAKIPKRPYPLQNTAVADLERFLADEAAREHVPELTALSATSCRTTPGQ